MKLVLAILTATAIGLGFWNPGDTNDRSIPAGATHGPPGDGEVVDFKNDLIPMFTKLGCNAGKCHGSAIGRGDFKLSLYGGTPRADYDEIVRKLGGRRVNFNAPSSSLLFQKPAEYVEHGGGTLLTDGDQHAEPLLRWIRQGAPYKEQRQLTKIEVTPSRLVAHAPGEKTTLQVTAHYDDGQVRDVTHLTQFVAEDPTAVSVDSEQATAVVARSGRHIVIARYATEVVPIEIMVPVTDSVVDLSSEPRHNEVDEQVIKVLTELRLPPSPAVDDRTFLRRITLDLTGRLPTSGRATGSEYQNREAMVDELLASEEFVHFYTLKLAKLLRIQSKIDKNKVTTTPEAARAFHDWLASQLREGVGYDQMARTILTATGDSSKYGPATFYTSAEDPRLQTEFVTEVFMASRMKCANCHNHPLDKWTQDDFHGLTAMFSKLTRSQVIRINPIGKNIHPNTGEAAAMKIPGGTILPAETQDGRQAFADWLTARENRYFAKAIVNRLWKSLMGRGLVEPVDDFRSTNPASHPALLDQLAQDFIQHGYDLRHTLKTIALSSTYGRSSNPVEGNEADDRFYSHMVRKPLEPEVLADAISDVLGVVDQYGDELPGTRAVQLRDGAIRSDALDILGRCNRTNSCEGAPSPTGPLAQKLHLFNGALLNGRIGASGGRLDRLIETNRNPLEIVREFYQVALNRAPSEEEIKLVSRWLDDQQPAASQREVLEDFVWSIVTCQEFVANH
ncbi:MAG: DUF1549 and DUF1553 domain-containing protein [Mariniblastus sp.]|nr:DUF1549 and DUF1553 domain-containing protein [Mariniblastus sp.]